MQTIRQKCLNRFSLFGRKQLNDLMPRFTKHYNKGRAHRWLKIMPPACNDPSPANNEINLDEIVCRKELGEVIKSYESLAAWDRCTDSQRISRLEVPLEEGDSGEITPTRNRTRSLLDVPVQFQLIIRLSSSTLFNDLMLCSVFPPETMLETLSRSSGCQPECANYDNCR